MVGLEYIDSPLGKIRIEQTGDAISCIHFVNETEPLSQESPGTLTGIAATQLNQYFSGVGTGFDFPTRQQGTDFQQRVWQELIKIRCGKTLSYLELARRLGDEKSIRAAASANGKNNLAIVVPCHRVIGTDGGLVGYAGGIWRKKWLLEHEAMMVGKGWQSSLF